MNVALMFAINDYPFAGADLNGCLNDQDGLIRKWQDYGLSVSSFAFKNKDCTHDRILKELEYWAARLDGRKDTFTFHYSGHGSYDSKLGSVHEGLFPWDGKLVYDIEFVSAFKKFDPYLDCLAILDSCFSGGMSRFFANPLIKNRFYQIEQIDEKEIHRGLTEPETIRTSIISGCSATQTSADYFDGTKYWGALTDNLIRSMKPGQSKRQWWSSANVSIQKRFEQDPLLIGNEKWFDTGCFGQKVVEKKKCLLKLFR